MADEKIKLDLDVPESFFDAFERRFQGAAQRALRGGLGGGSSGGGAGFGGGSRGGGAAGGESFGGGISKALGGGESFGGAGAALLDVGLGSLNGARQGIRGLRGESANSGTVAADAAISGGLSGFVESTVGKVPILGDWIVAQMNAAKDAIEVPRDRASSRLGARFSALAKSGYDVSDDEIKQGLKFQNQVEERGYKAEQRVERINREMHPTSAAFGLSWSGNG